MADEDEDEAQEPAMGWDGGAEQSAARAELERLKKLGEGLRDLAAEAGRVGDPDRLAAIQDRNLEAFEAMTAEMGLAALDRMRRALSLLSDAPGAPATAEAAPPAPPSDAAVAAAQSEIEAWRDRETAALLRALRGHFQAAPSVPARDDAAFEPFEALGPDHGGDKRGDRGKSG